MFENEFNQINQRTDLDLNEDIERDLDYDDEVEEKDLRDKVLFAIQGLGSIKTIKRNGKPIEAYIKGDYCEESIKDLIKYIRKDVPENPKASLILSHFNIVESDLTQILALHAEDKKLMFWLLGLMSYLTSKPIEGLNEVEKDQLNEALRKYKKSFMNSSGLTSLIIHIAEYVKTPVEERKKSHYQFMEFIIVLVRNLLQVQSKESDGDEIHSHFLLAIIKEDLMGPLFYLLQMEKGELLDRIKIPLLEIFYHIFTCFDPQVLCETRKSFNFKQEAMRNSQRKPEPVRHSRFMPNFAETNQSGVNRVVHSLNKSEEPLPGQRKVPSKRAELNKVKKIEREYIEENFLELRIDPQNDGNRKIVKELIIEYANEFVEVEFEHLSRLVFNDIYRETAKINKNNVVQYLVLCCWELKMTRCQYQKAQMNAKTAQEKGSVEFELGQILCVMQTTHFELIYKLLYREATREKKKNFDINTFHAALKLFLTYLEVIEDISLSLSQSDRKNANALMANVFRHDIARILKIGFHQIYHEKILRTLILLTHKFFKLLSEYSKGNVLTLMTGKLLKGKKKNKKEQEEDERKELEGFISQDSDEDESGSYKEGEEKKQKKEKPITREEIEEEARFQERKFNEMTEFAVVADYEVINKYLVFLRHERFLTNSKELNLAIFFYVDRIVNMLKGEWLFFQAETLIVFSEILNSSQFAKEYQKQRETVKKISALFIKLLKNNKLALVESLFRYSSVQTKDQIVKNYQDEIEERLIELDDDDL